jgi:hypothetical protein
MEKGPAPEPCLPATGREPTATRSSAERARKLRTINHREKQGGGGILVALLWEALLRKSTVG